MARAPSSSSGEFDREKVRVLEKADLSRKGSVDAPIRELVEYINTKDDYYTTSSCSGRAVVFCEVGLVNKQITQQKQKYKLCRSRDNGRRVVTGYSSHMIPSPWRVWLENTCMHTTRKILLHFFTINLKSHKKYTDFSIFACTIC